MVRNNEIIEHKNIGFGKTLSLQLTCLLVFSFLYYWINNTLGSLFAPLSFLYYQMNNIIGFLFVLLVSLLMYKNKMSFNKQFKSSLIIAIGVILLFFLIRKSILFLLSLILYPVAIMAAMWVLISGIGYLIIKYKK